MSRKNLLSLHEAIVVALINKPTRTASFDEIAKFIEERNLYPERKGNITLATQIMLRATKAKGAYHHLFQEIGASFLRFKNTPDPLGRFIDLEAIFNHHQSLFQVTPQKIRMFDVKLGRYRFVTAFANNIISILTKEKSGEKKYAYIRESDLKGNDSIGIYTLNGSLGDILDLLDPRRHYLAVVNDSTIVNVAFYEIGPHKVVKPTLQFSEIISLPQMKFSTSPAAKKYFIFFEKIQEGYLSRISFENTILRSKKELQPNF